MLPIIIEMGCEKSLLSTGQPLKNLNKILNKYDLKVYNGQGSITEADIIYRDKIFCTAQSTNQSNNEHYTINKDVYKEKSGNNDFIIL